MIALPTMTGDAVGKLSNVIALIGGDGQLIGMYDKNYPTVGEMDHGVLPGRQPLAVDTTLGRVGFAICFDLNFAELRQAYVQAKVGLLLFASMFHGGHAQTTWAREMGAYFVSAVAGLPSGIIDPLGRVVCTSTNYTPHATAAVDLDYCLAHLDGNRPGLDRLKRDLGQAVRISDPGLSGIVMISSHAPDRTASQLAAAFDITPLRDYLAQSRAARDRYLD